MAISREKKVKTIIKAIESGISRKKVNPQSNGTRAGLLLREYRAAKQTGASDEKVLYKGSGVGDGLLENMYQNVLVLQSKDSRHVEALKENRTSKDNKKKGVRKSFSERQNLQKQIAELEEKLSKMQRQNVELEEKAETTRREIEALQSGNAELRQENIAQQQKIESLRREIGEVQRGVDTDSPTDGEGEIDKKDLHGFCVTQRKAGAGRNEYWYAGKRINNKLVWVYIGKEKHKAKEKIEAWLEQNPQSEKQGDLFENVE